MKKTNVILLMAVCVVLVGCGKQNLPEVMPVMDGAVDAVVEAPVNTGNQAGGIMDELKKRNQVEDGVAVTYVIDTQESSVNWKADRILSAGHFGTVTIKEGSAVYENNMLQSATAVLDMTTITSDGGDALNKHLNSDDFFAVESYPEATIVITSTKKVESPEGDVTMATADLTIKGITNEITFPIVSDEYWDTATITIDRTLWDIKYGSEKFFDDLADKAIKDEIIFEVNIAYVNE